MKNKNNFFIILGLFIVASIARIVFDSNQYVLHIIATINIISLWYVLYLIIEGSDNLFKSLLKNNNVVGDNIKIKKRILFKRIVQYIRILILILGLIYIIFFANSIINDILGLFALFLSIETEHLCDFIANHFNNKK